MPIANRWCPATEGSSFRDPDSSDVPARRLASVHASERIRSRSPQGSRARPARWSSIGLARDLRSHRGGAIEPRAGAARARAQSHPAVGVEIKKVAGVGSLPSCHLPMIWAQPSWRLVNDRIGIGIPTDGTSTVRTSSGVQYRGTTLPAGKEQEPTVLSRVWLTCHPGGKEDRGGSCTVTRLYRHLRSAGEGGQSCCCN